MVDPVDPALGSVQGNNHDNWRMQSMTSAVAIEWDSESLRELQSEFPSHIHIIPHPY